MKLRHEINKDSKPSTPCANFKEARSAVLYLVKYSADMATVSADMAALTTTRKNVPPGALR